MDKKQYQKVYQKKYRAENREKLLAYAKQYYEDNRERLLQQLHARRTKEKRESQELFLRDLSEDELSQPTT